MMCHVLEMLGPNKSVMGQLRKFPASLGTLSVRNNGPPERSHQSKSKQGLQFRKESDMQPYFVRNVVNSRHWKDI